MVHLSASGPAGTREPHQLRNLIYARLYPVTSSFLSHYFVETAPVNGPHLQFLWTLSTPCHVALGRGCWAHGLPCALSAVWLASLSRAAPGPPTRQASLHQSCLIGLPLTFSRGYFLHWKSPFIIQLHNSCPPRRLGSLCLWI